MVAFQLLRNMVKIWEMCLKQNSRLKKLPVILPLLFYHGKQKWNISPHFADLIEKISSTEQYIPKFLHETIDISHIEDKDICGAILTRIFLITLKYAFKPELIEKLDEIFGMLNKISEKT